jgi:hypothetical protein
MKKILISLVALALPLMAQAEYNPFNPKPATPEVVTVAPEVESVVPNATAPDAPKDPQQSPNIDDELKLLLKKLEQSETQVKGDEVEFIASVNCVDIYYHTDTKLYEERITKSCIKQATKDKINKEIKTIQEKSKNDRGQHDQKN